MSEIIRIKPVSSRAKIEVLREFGHRAFVEIGDDGKPIGYFVETKETAGTHVSAQKPGRRTPVTKNQALVWIDKTVTYKKGLPARFASLVKELAAVPTRRAELVDAIVKEAGISEVQATNLVSVFTGDGYLVIPG